MLMKAGLCAFALAMATPAAAQNVATEDETAAVSAAVYDYFGGQTERSAERLNRAFAAEAPMIGVRPNDDGELAVTVWEMKNVLPNWAKGDPAPEPRKGRILSVNIVDDRIATVMFDSDGRFYDALTLAKIDGQWKIIAKAFVLQ